MAAFARGMGLSDCLVARMGLGWRKGLRRLGLRGLHPHPPTPSPASGRGGETRSHKLACLGEIAICARKALRRLGLRGRHPHPPAPSPASGRGGEASSYALACLRAIACDLRAQGFAALGVARSPPSPPDPLSRQRARGRSGQTKPNQTKLN